MAAIAKKQPTQNRPTPKPSGEQLKQATEQAGAMVAPVAKMAPPNKA